MGRRARATPRRERRCEDAVLPQERAKIAMQLKHLVTPAGMGETFHVLILSKNLPRELVTALSGMRFAR